jgi:hypothetical protein
MDRDRLKGQMIRVLEDPCSFCNVKLKLLIKFKKDYVLLVFAPVVLVVDLLFAP